MSGSPKWRKTYRVTAPAMAGIVAALGLAACSSAGASGGGSGTGIPKGPIYVAEFISLTGADAALGFELKIFNQVFKIFNENGGVDGHPIQATVFDDKSDPATGLSEAESVAGNPKYSAVTWTSSGDPTQTITLEVMKGKLPNIEFEMPSYLLGAQYPYYWTTAPVTSMQAERMASYIHAEGLKPVGVLSDGTPFGIAFAQEEVSDLNKLGVPNQVYTYSPTSADVAATLKKMQDAGVKVVSPVGELDLNGVISGFQSLGWYPKIVGSEVLAGYYSSALPQQVLDNTVMACQFYATQQDASAYKVSPLEAKLLNVTAAISGRNPADSDTIADYDALLILKAAILKADSTNREAIDKAMTSLPSVPSVVPGFSYHFTSSNHVGWLAKNEGICGLNKFANSYDIPIALPGWGSS